MLGLAHFDKSNGEFRKVILAGNLDVFVVWRGGDRRDKILKHCLQKLKL